MTRISGSGYSGAAIDLGGSITDIALESSNTGEVTYSGVSFRGTASLYRLNGDSLGFYFVRAGRSFNDGTIPRHGFASDTNVGVYVKDTEGNITSSGAEVTFYHPGIKDVLINGISVGILDLGDDWIKIYVPSGTHDIKFDTVPIPRGAIAGTVTDSITGFPIEGTTVSDGTRFDRTDAGGNYFLTYSPVDTFTVTALISGYLPLSIDSVVVTENDTSTVDFQLTEVPTGAISGTVTDIRTGSPIQGAMVSDGTRSDSTDAGGNYTITDIPVDTYTITALGSGYSPLSIDSVVVTEDNTSVVDFQLTNTFDLVGFWAFEESSGTSAYDSSGRNNDGIIYGPTSIQGRLGLAYQFDGKDDYITVPRSASLDGIKDEITMIAWVKIHVGSRQTLFERWFAGGVGERAFELDISDNGNVSFGLCGNGTSYSTWLLSDNTIISDKWTHVAATSDGLTMKMYINGVLDPQIAAPPTSIHTSAANLHIGRWEFESYEWYYPLNGNMDEVKIYNRALTAREISDDYNLAPIGINENPVSLLPEDGLLQVYPNPFNSSTTIRYKTTVSGKVTISIYNLTGQKIWSRVNEAQQADNHSVVWDGTTATGGSAGSGIYFCILKIDNKTIATKKLVLLK